MTSHSPTQKSAESESIGALDELLSAEREIGARLAEADAQAARILEDARHQIAAHHAAFAAALAQELAALESTLRSEAAEESNALVDSTRAITARFDNVTGDEVAGLAEFVLQRLYELTPPPAEQAP